MKSKSYFDVLDAAAQRRVPDQVDLFPRIAAQARRAQSSKTFRPRKLALAVLFVLLAFAILVVSVPALAQAMGRWLGFIPGIGIIDTSAPLRVLAEPLTLTRDGVTLTVEEALLSADQTTITYSVAGVPSSAYPRGEIVVSCLTLAYLQLPDGTTLEISRGSGGGFAPSYRVQLTYAAVPAEVNEATFILPCLDGTLPGSQPENWRLPLQFIPAPPALTVMPVIELPTATAMGGTASASSALELLSSLDQVIELDNGYIFAGAFHTVTLPNGTTAYASDQSGLTVSDATGAEITTQSAPEPESAFSSTDNFPWAFQVEGKQFAWPLTITLESARIYLPAQEAKFEFDTGPDPQEGQEWVLNKDFELGDVQVRVVSIQRSADGYQFNLHTDQQIAGAGAWIEGFPGVGGGGGGDGHDFSSSSIYAGELPEGKLTIGVSILQVEIIQRPWSVSWQPEGVQNNEPQITATVDASLCVSSANIAQLQPAPATMSGKVLLYHLLDDGQTWGVTMSNLDGSQQQTIGNAGGWASLSPDGSAVAYPDIDGLTILHLASGAADHFAGVNGYNISWSPDGSRLAFIGAGADWEIYLIGADGTGLQQLTNDGYPKAIAGWSPDGQELYFTADDAEGQTLWAIELASQRARALFVLDNASLKAPFAKISPDGSWIAYRDINVSSLYLVKIDNTEQRIVLREPDTAIATIEWSGDWLSLSLADARSEARSVLLLQPQTCEAFLLPNMHGDLQGLKLP